MSESETKHDLMLKRIQLILGIAAGVTTVIVGVYNVRNIFFKKQEPVKVVEPVRPAPQSSKLREAVEDVGAEWIKKLGSPK